MRAFKLFKKRADGSLGPLFINAKQRIPIGVWLEAEDHPTKGFAHRPGWHCCEDMVAPHLTKKANRVWCEVEIEGHVEFLRPANQGGMWYLAERMKVIQEVW